MIITSHQIVRCCKSDLGTSIADLESSARYCEEIGKSAALNPWASAADSPAYLEAARELWAQAEDKRLAMLDVCERAT
jgi:hypothetical protein